MQSKNDFVPYILKNAVAHNQYVYDQLVALFPRAMSQVPCLHEHLANAARVNTPLLAAGLLTRG